MSTRPSPFDRLPGSWWDVGYVALYTGLDRTTAHAALELLTFRGTVVKACIYRAERYSVRGDADSATWWWSC